MGKLNNRSITVTFLFWRIFLFLPLFFSEKLISYRKGFEYTSSLHFTNASNPITYFLLSPWANFDGVYYLIIAAGGYTVDNVGFFPLFPLLINIFSLGNNVPFLPFQLFIALILSSTLFLTSLFIFYKLLRLDYDHKISYQSILFMILFPTSFFFATIYSESLFLLLLISSFYFARKKKWFLSSVFAMFLTTTRLVGVAIIPALIYEFIVQEGSLIKKKAILLLLIPLGIASFSYFNFLQWGRPLQFLTAQGALHNNRSVGSIVLFPQTIFRYLKILVSVKTNQFEWWIALLEILAFMFASIMLYIAWKKRVRISYLIFAILAVLIPVSTGTLTGFPRYALIVFPIFIAIALVRNRYFKIVYLVSGIILLFILFALFSKGYYIS